MSTKQHSSNLSCYQNPPFIKGSYFENKKIEMTRVNKRLLSVSLLLSNTCDLHCKYCYRDAGISTYEPFSILDWHEVLLQSKNLGAKNVWIPGSGEPLLDPSFCDGHSFPLLELCNSMGLSVTFFTNGTLLNKKLSKMLVEYDVSVVTKLNSFNPNIQDYLAGKSGAFLGITRGLNHLLEVGLAGENPSRLGIDTVIVAQNYNEIPQIFRYCRDRNIIPYITANLHGGRACSNKVLDVSRSKLRSLFEYLLQIDRKEYGYSWFPSPPIVASHCKKLFYDIVIDSKGDVLVCPGIEIPLGNIKERRLSDILGYSELFEKIRNMPNSLVGACRTCSSESCSYGCRLEAFTNGNLFGNDPMCWHFKDKTNRKNMSQYENTINKGPNSKYWDARA